MEPKVSIITVVYNCADFLEKALNSVLNQTYTEVEYIIIDGGSTDGTVEIIKKYAEKISKWVSEKDEGIYEAMNKGLSYATGDLIGILNADDWYETDAIQKVVNAYQKHPDGQIFHGLLAFRDGKGKLEYISGHTSDYFLKGMEHPTCFVKKQVYEQHGFFDSSFKSAGDYELMLRFRKKGLIFIFIKEILANFRSGGASDSLTSAIETINLNYKYGLISNTKRLALLLYWRFKTLTSCLS